MSLHNGHIPPNGAKANDSVKADVAGSDPERTFAESGWRLTESSNFSLQAGESVELWQELWPLTERIWLSLATLPCLCRLFEQRLSFFFCVVAYVVSAH